MKNLLNIQASPEIINKLRRSIVIGLPLLSSGFMAGCIATGSSGIKFFQSKSQPKGFYKSIYYSTYDPKTDAPGVFEVYDKSKSAISKYIFDTVRDKGIIPRIVDMPTAQQLEQANSYINEVKNKYAGQKELGIDEALDVAEHIIPFLRMYADLNSPELNSGIEKNTAFSVSRDGTLTIPPGYKVVSIQQGYCLDQNLGAPGKGEILSLQPAGTLIPAELQPLYKAMQMKALYDESYRAKMQNLLWTLRSAGQAQSLASQVTAQTLRDMDVALPGGAQTFVDYHNHLLKKTASPSGTPSSRNWITNPSENSILGLINTLAGRGDKNVKGQSSQDIFDSLVDGMNRGITGAPPTDDRDYQMLAPSVASHAIGAGTLKPQIRIINASNKPYTINFSDWIAKPGRAAQHVAMYPSISQNLGTERFPVATPDFLTTLKDLKNSAASIASGLLHFGAGLYLKNFSQSPEFLGLATRFLKNNPAAKALVSSMPFIGNALCLYEAMTGLSWLTGKPINAFDRVAAGLGVIPLGGAFKGVLNEKAISIAGQVFAAAGITTNLGWENPVAKYAKAYNSVPEFASKYTMDALSGNLNKGLMNLANSGKFSKTESEQIKNYLSSESAGWYYMKY
jgi:hypothetical protein